MPDSPSINTDELLRLRRARPFLPFAFELKSGVSYDVLEGTRFCTNGRGVMLFGPSGAVEHFQLSDVTGLRPLSVSELAAHIEAGHFRR